MLLLIIIKTHFSIRFHFHNDFHKKGVALILVLKGRVWGCKWPICIWILLGLKGLTLLDYYFVVIAMIPLPLGATLTITVNVTVSWDIFLFV